MKEKKQIISRVEGRMAPRFVPDRFSWFVEF